MTAERTDFHGAGAALDEHWFAMSSVPADDFREEAADLLARYAALAAGSTRIWVRFHLSDIANQAADLRRILGEDAPMVGQPPVGGSRIALEAYHLTGGSLQLAEEGDCRELRLANYRQLWFHTARVKGKGSGAQMRGEFDAAERLLKRFGGSVAANLQRTWIYCRDIDNNYAGLVAGRRERFRRYGLLPETHYIASTGIEGLSDPHDRLVRMDSFALFGHRPEQVEYLHAVDHMPPTHVYGVTFERGTRIVYGDRSHSFLSGTASIDADGKVLHPNDISLQAERMADNVEALLAGRGGALADLRQAVVYLRDPADAPAVEAVLARRLSPETARIMVRGSVCRPGWLVEMDGIAVNSRGNPDFKVFA